MLSNPKAIKELVIGTVILAVGGAICYQFLFKRK